MDLGIKGKKALVTGSGRGIGRSIAINLAKEGVKVAIVSRTQSDLDNVLKEMGGEEKGHYAISCDFTEEGMPCKVVSEIQGKIGHLDIVVNNLGGDLIIKDPFCPISDWRKVWRINMEVGIEINNLVIPHMRKKKWGRIVNISSISSMENHGPVTYCSVKAALTAYTRSIGRFVAPDGVVVSAVLPGAVFVEKGYWDITSKENPEHVRKFLTERQRIGRFGRPEEIANFVTYLCSDLASFNTGSIIPIDGGQGRGYFGQ